MGDVVCFPNAPDQREHECGGAQPSSVAEHVNPALAGMLYISVDLLEKLVAELQAALAAMPLGPDQVRLDENCRTMLATIEAAKAKLKENDPRGTVSRAANPPA